MTKIKIVGALIFTLSIILAILFNHVNEQSRVSNNLLNTINQQKAFTQEISKNIFYIYKNNHVSCSQLDNSIKHFISNMNSRENKLDIIDSIAIKNKSAEILILWNTFYLEVQKFRDISKTTTTYSRIITEKLVNNIYKINLKLVVEFDKLIDIHQSEMQSSITIYKNIEYTLFFLLVTLLIYLFTQIKKILYFIQKFLTTSKQVISNSSVKDLQPISNKAKDLNSNISNATNNFNFLVNKINSSIEYSSESIQHSYKSLEIVENSIEDFLELIYSMEDDKELNKEISKKEDAIIQTLEELTSATQHLKDLKIDLDNLTSHKSNSNS